jgi:hypothetical protein
MDGCNHVICESCYWQCAVLWEAPIDEGDVEYESKDIICPVCSAFSTKSKKEERTFLGEHSSGNIILPDKHTASFIPLPMVSNEDREKSIQLYLALPETLPCFGCSDRNESTSTPVRNLKIKKSKFRALPRSLIAGIHMGTIRSQRNEELWKAAGR